jgi:uncharacterized protein (UPF0264 family)
MLLGVALVLQSRQHLSCVFVAPLLLLQVAASAGADVLSSDISSWQLQLFAADGQHLSAAALSQHCTSCVSSAAAAAGLAAAVGGAAVSGAAKVGCQVATSCNAMGARAWLCIGGCMVTALHLSPDCRHRVLLR